MTIYLGEDLNRFEVKRSDKPIILYLSKPSSNIFKILTINK